ncbi:hypothetical protein F5X97DRAFT_340394 [Nemania serpens]|nr:hypothetical protein F5X97DRAFT_340394 [Nemania serpens]
MSLAQLPFLPPSEQQAILNQAALPPPQGQTSNFENPPNNNDLALKVCVLCLTVSSILLLVRSYTRIVVLKIFRVEDVPHPGRNSHNEKILTILLSQAAYAAYMYAAFRFLHNIGYFVHQWDLQVKSISEFRYILLIGASFYDADILFIKVAILLDWLHLFVPGKTRNWFFWVCWAVLTVNTLYYIANIIAVNLTCIPFEASWNVLVTGKCLDQKALDTSSAAINLVSDVAIMALAQHVIWNLHMSTRKKIGLSIIFAAGLFGTISGLFRLIVTIEYQHQEDTTYTVSAVILWAIGEMTSGFLVFCVPSIPKAVGRIRNGINHATHYGLRSSQKNQTITWKKSNPLPSKDFMPHGHRHSEPDDAVPITTFSSTSLPLDAQSTEYWAHDADDDRVQTQPTRGGIIRTTQVVTAVDDDVDNQAVKLTHNRQHP